MLAVLSDDKLVDYVRSGDAVAFEVLYDRHNAGVLGFCRHMLGSAQDAEDAVQHAFIAAHADLQRHADREIHFKAWLYTIARNRCLSLLRARRDQPGEDIEIVTDRLSDDVQQREDLRALLADIHRLPDDQREALVLSEVGALSHTEVAEVIGCEVAKVKSLVFQGRTALIDRRLARETSCADIREQIATLRGGSLRRSHLRHHIEACPGCSEYREQIRHQRQMLALALPVVPSAALRGHVMSAVGIGGGTTAAAGGASVTGLAVATKSGLAKFGVAALLAGGAAGGAAVVHTGGFAGIIGTGSSSSVDQGGGKAAGAAGAASAGRHNAGTAGRRSKTVSGGNGPATGSHAGGRSDAVSGGSDAVSGGNGPAGKSHAGGRSDSGTEHGFTPVQGGSNGDAAKQRAATQGDGNHTGITKTHTPTRTRTGQGGTPPVHVKKAPVTNAPKTPNANASPKAQPSPPAKSAPQSHAPAKTTPPAKSAPQSHAPAKTTPPPSAQTAPAPDAPAPAVTTNPGGASPNGNAKGVAKHAAG